MRKILVILLLICFQTQAQQQLALEEAINIALKNSFDIQLARNNVDANTILNNYGVAGGLPTVSATGTDNEQITTLNQKLSNGTNTNRTGVTANNLNANVTGSILLYNGMRVVSTKNRLEVLQHQSEQLLNSQIQKHDCVGNDAIL
jgi:outer membrane protein TolC